MSPDIRNDARAFRDFLDERLAGEGGFLPLDEALGLWDFENQADQERDASLAAIRQGFGDIEAGRIRPAREALEEIRRKHHLPPLS